ncbi:tautomerase family protein [Zhongshania marina]|uniref:Tautomerase n=1 Tax=Zhongshania marina TaxID=2304603 RepID=A0A2S4HKK4_9GAMM|nr:2-hydroxymuconate tautomerase family protein [Marortus luteolus]POP54479.1 4-oxalocrotonate tautomerase [Marortus luteolus]
MPIIQFNLMTGRSAESKRRLVNEVTKTVSDVLEVAPETVRILIHELQEEDFAVAGVSVAESKERLARSNGHVSAAMTRELEE